MQLRAPKTVSAIVLAGLLSAGSALGRTAETAQTVPDAQLLAADQSLTSNEKTIEAKVGLVPPAAAPVRPPHAAGSGSDAFAGGLPLDALTGGVAGLGIPQIVLAAYRNAELALAQSDPGCHLPWNLLAGIGKVESQHANGGKTDAAGTTVGTIHGPALDGTLPGNEVISSKDSKGRVVYTKAIGPMQFLPTTWKAYQADGNGDGVADPNNIYDAALGAGKYLCSGGMDLKDPTQELRAILRYNNSVKYANDVRRWSNAYRTGAVPSAVSLDGLIDPQTLDDMSIEEDETTTKAATTTTTAPACAVTVFCPPPGVDAGPPPPWLQAPAPAAPAPAAPPPPPPLPKL